MLQIPPARINYEAMRKSRSSETQSPPKCDRSQDSVVGSQN